MSDLDVLDSANGWKKYDLARTDHGGHPITGCVLFSLDEKMIKAGAFERTGVSRLGAYGPGYRSRFWHGT